jgi:hypothetical protein
MHVDPLGIGLVSRGAQMGFVELLPSKPGGVAPFPARAVRVAQAAHGVRVRGLVPWGWRVRAGLGVAHGGAAWGAHGGCMGRAWRLHVELGIAFVSVSSVRGVRSYVLCTGVCGGYRSWVASVLPAWLVRRR